jgi:hypothetical protein
VRGFVVEGILEALQFENQGGALRSHRATVIGIVDPVLRGFVETSGCASSSHALTPSTTGARPTVLAFVIGCAAVLAFPIGCATVFAFPIDCGTVFAFPIGCCCPTAFAFGFAIGCAPGAGRPADAPTRAKIS